jgi:antitoxin (DNA-binding transcriptional repressor) of toxin-antitoxin stability system
VKTLTVSEVAKHFGSVLDRIERDQEEILLFRNRRPVARLIPEPAPKNALEMLNDVCGKLVGETAEALANCVNRARRGNRTKLDSLRNPWAS